MCLKAAVPESKTSRINQKIQCTENHNSRVLTSAERSSIKGQGAHTVCILHRVLGRFSVLTTVLMLSEHLIHSMADPNIIYFTLFLFTKSTTEYCSQSTSQTHWSKWKPGEDHSFTQRVPWINAQNLNRMGLGPLPFLSFNVAFSFHLLSLLHLSYKFMKELIVKVVDQLSENCKQFL